jgi:hypothetical protein
MTDRAPATDEDPLHTAASRQTQAYADLSRRCAAAGDGRRAALAVWAADVTTLQCLLWESGLGEAPDPQAQLAAVGHAVDASLRTYADSVGRATATEVVAGARAALTAAFDASVHALLSERFSSLDHLDGLPPAAAGAADSARESRLGGRSVEQLVDELRAAAADCMAVAGAMARAGLHDDAQDHARKADLASFEAYLLQAATDAGDQGLDTVDLRWELALSVLATGDETDDRIPLEDLRERLLAVVTPVEAGALRACLEPVPVGVT